METGCPAATLPSWSVLSVGAASLELEAAQAPEDAAGIVAGQAPQLSQDQQSQNRSTDDQSQEISDPAYLQSKAKALITTTANAELAGLTAPRCRAGVRGPERAARLPDRGPGAQPRPHPGAAHATGAGPGQRNDVFPGRPRVGPAGGRAGFSDGSSRAECFTTTADAVSSLLRFRRGGHTS